MGKNKKNASLPPLPPPPPYNPTYNPQASYGSVTTVEIPDGTTATIINQPVSSAPATIVLQETCLGAIPATTVCSNCRAYILGTDISFENGLCTWLSFASCVLLGCWAGCCVIPFCIDSLKDVRHSCPNCNNTIGYYRRI